MSTARVDVVIVAHASRDTLRACVAPLADAAEMTVTVVDTASADPGFDTVQDLDVTLVPAPRNGGFAYGCNLGIACGTAPYVLLLNPDATMTPEAVRTLAGVLDADPGIGLVAPRIVDEHGVLQRSVRRFPRLRSAWSKALFLHRLAPDAAWSDDLVHACAFYERPQEPDWVSGACMLVRRDALAALGGLDEGFFMYAEDTDLCARLWARGLRVRYEPAAGAVHGGGHSAPRSALRTADVRSHIRYVLKHDGPRAARVAALATALDELTHLVVRARRPGYPRGHLAGLRAALQAALSPSRSAALAGRSPFRAA
ncbi:glycosyltransferase family 2 protein [Baekduia soli]|uniref:Glycosyltransferase family 2 protein n=1 Tax=Baekduia soli TaxID=496014 RepID=A0A5B8UA59_9ACTN|nr:glycosyltransferase family 2 protein [Baekduia soli]QEC50089.1 glycosyltransferase family 2 protein [Baekduia soli]